jgi:hypothetical protein
MAIDVEDLVGILQTNLTTTKKRYESVETTLSTRGGEPQSLPMPQPIFWLNILWHRVFWAFNLSF